MYSTLAVLLLLAGAATIEGCNMADVQKCSLIAPKSQTAEAMCKAQRDVKACFEKVLSTCDASIKAQFSQQMEAQMQGSKGMCDQESSCSIMEMQKCTKGMPQEMPKDMSVVCPTLESVTNCFTRMLSGCENEEMKSNIMTQMQTFSPMKEACDKMSGGSGGDGSYATGGETRDGNDDMDKKEQKGGEIQDGTDGASGLQVTLSLIAASVLVQLFSRM